VQTNGNWGVEIILTAIYCQRPVNNMNNSTELHITFLLVLQKMTAWVMVNVS
jgi:hypothetical protein